LNHQYVKQMMQMVLWALLTVHHLIERIGAAVEGRRMLFASVTRQGAAQDSHRGPGGTLHAPLDSSC
jgi:hypothetical protein